MLKAIVRAIKTRRLREQENLCRRGYDYAAGRMLKDGDCAVGILRQQVESSRDFKSYNEFDAGIEQAIRDFRDLQKPMF